MLKFKGRVYCCFSSVIRLSLFIPKQSQKSRSILYDRVRSLELFRKGKTCKIAKFHRTDSVICCKTLSYVYSRINTVYEQQCKFSRITFFLLFFTIIKDIRSLSKHTFNI